MELKEILKTVVNKKKQKTKKIIIIIVFYYMTWVCSGSNACSDWLILGHYSPVMPTGRLRACKSQALERSVFTGKSQTSAFRSVNTERSRSEIFP